MATAYTSITAISSTQVVIAYQNGSTTYGNAVVGTVSGTGTSATITLGTVKVLNAVATTYTSVTALSSTQVVIAYRNGSTTYGNAVVGTVSGTGTSAIITTGTIVAFNAVSTSNPYIAMITPTEVVIAYQNLTTTYGNVVLGTVSGTTITFGSEYVCNAADTQSLSIVALDANRIAVAYYDYDEYGNYYGHAGIGTINSDYSITFSRYVFNYNSATNISITAIDSSHIAIAYRDTGNSYYGSLVIGTISESEITFGSEYVFNAAGTDYTSITAIDSGNIAIAYRNVGNSNYGTAVIFTQDGAKGVNTAWSNSWPSEKYMIKFGTGLLTGTGTPDVWYTIDSFISTTELKLTEPVDKDDFLPAGTPYVIKKLDE